MKTARMFGGIAALVALVVLALILTNHPARGSDHQDSQATIARPGADVTDTFLFPSPANSNNVVAVMNVRVPTGGFFDPTVLYQMKFDTRVAGEAVGAAPVENVVIQFSFGAPGNGAQQVLVYGPAAPNAPGTLNTLVPQTGAGLFNSTFSVGAMAVFAGLRQDPSFFDQAQWFRIFPDRNGGSTAQSCLPVTGSGTCPTGFSAVGADAFATANVLAIVVEMPKATLTANGTGPKVAYWATTSSTSGQ